MHIEVKDIEDINEAQRQYEFYKLSKRFNRHYHKANEPNDIRVTCLVCQAIKEIERGQSAVAEMLDGQSRNGRYEHGYNPAKPF